MQNVGVQWAEEKNPSFIEKLAKREKEEGEDVDENPFVAGDVDEDPFVVGENAGEGGERADVYDISVKNMSVIVI